MAGIKQFEAFCLDRGGFTSRVALYVLREFRKTVPKNRSPRPATAPRMTPRLKARIRSLDRQGLNQHQIAAELGVNPGRVNETLKEKLRAPTAL